jgi:hypothetical protein
MIRLDDPEAGVWLFTIPVKVAGAPDLCTSVDIGYATRGNYFGCEDPVRIYNPVFVRRVSITLA